MNTQEVRSEVYSIIKKWLPDKDRAFNDQTTLEDLDYDSLDKIELIMELENVFDISIDDNVLETINTVGDVVLVVNRQMT